MHHPNVAEMQAKTAIREEKSATAATRREYVEHFIATLDDRGLEKQLKLLRFMDVDEMEEILRACQRMETSG